MKAYSALSVIKHAWHGHRRWPRAWRDPEPRASYEVVIIEKENELGGHAPLRIARRFGQAQRPFEL